MLFDSAIGGALVGIVIALCFIIRALEEQTTQLVAIREALGSIAEAVGEVERETWLVRKNAEVIAAQSAPSAEA
jgi:hypothetical protein